MKNLKQWAARTVLLAILGGIGAGWLYAEQHGAVAGLGVGYLTANALALAANLRRTGFALGAETLVADLALVPETFVPYSVEVTAERSELIRSGIIEDNEQFARRADIGFDVNITADTLNHGGQFTSLPFWNDLSGDDEVISDTDSLTTGKMTSANEMAVIHNRAKAWSHNDLAAILAASDPATAMGQRLGTYWERRLQAMALATLKGVFGAASMAGNSLDLHLTSGSTFTDANYLTADSAIDARQLLGDAKDNLTAYIMHSRVEAALEKYDLIDTIPGSEQGTTIKVFGGKRVILDDTMTIEVINDANVYSTFLFGRGAMAYGVGAADGPIYGAAPGSTWAAERARETLAGQNIFVTRRRNILHPRGFKFTNTAMAGVSPTNLELANALNWVRVWEPKAIPMVRVRHNVEL